MSDPQPSAEIDRITAVVLRHRFVDVPGSEVGFCAGPYCAGVLISPETYAAHLADMLSRVIPSARTEGER